MKAVDQKADGRCPFCENRGVRIDSDILGTYQVTCLSCGARGPLMPTGAAALEWWIYQRKPSS